MNNETIKKIVIEIDDVYRIELDNYRNHTLYQRYEVKNGENKGKYNERVLGYFSNIRNALQEITTQELLGDSQGKVYNFKEFVEAYDNVIERLDVMLDKHGERIKAEYTKKRKG